MISKEKKLKKNFQSTFPLNRSSDVEKAGFLICNDGSMIKLGFALERLN
jgi:hypothetical protein